MREKYYGLEGEEIFKKLLRSCTIRIKLVREYKSLIS